jgi:hypothetical protein
MVKKIIILITAILMVSCYEESATVEIDGKNPPTFELTGSGTPFFCVVGEVTEDNKELTEKNKKEWPSNVIWQIKPDSCSQYGVWSISPLIYGKTPKCYIQTFPKEGTPSPLIEGKKYYFSVPTYGAQGTGMIFIIKGGKSVPVDN